MTIAITTPEQITAYTALALRARLKIECAGMKASRGASALSIVKKLHGIKARTAAQALPLYEQILRSKGILRDRAPGAATSEA